MARWRGPLAVVAIFSALGLLFSTQIYLDSFYTRANITARQALTLALAGWYGWMVLAPLVFWLARRFSLAVHVVASFVLTFGKLFMTSTLLGMAGFGPRMVTSTINIPLNYVTYWTMVGTIWALDSHRQRRAERLRASQLEASLATARLDALTLQLQPHFLFNTLNSIAELMHENVTAAERMVGELSTLLRASLDGSHSHEVPLERELAFLEQYLNIERVRFDERLRVKIDASPNARDALVPRLLLQPLVENAVRHAVTPRAAGGTIVIEAAKAEDRLTIRVKDDGPASASASGIHGANSANGVNGVGIGLTNTRARLEALYGDRQTFEIRLHEAGGAEVTITLPFRAAANESADGEDQNADRR
jgi:two-component system, LytTR family, sensor kinase